MRINVPGWARVHFWDEPPIETWEFWAFRWQPVCCVGELIEFYFDSERVAVAQVAEIEPPGKSADSDTGQFKDRWKVYWHNTSFHDIRGEQKQLRLM
jgi:hypothetical protein